MAKKKEETKKNKKKETKTVETAKEVKKGKKEKVKEAVVEKTEVKPKAKRNSDDLIFKFFAFFDKYRLAIYGLVGGVLITVLVAILIWPDRIAKLEDGTEPVAQIDGLVITADDLYEEMKKSYSISALVDKIDNKLLTEKYPETEEMNLEIKNEAENYYSVYEQYNGMSKEDFLASNGFANEQAFLDYLKLMYRRNLYAEDYAKSLVTEKELNDYYEKEVYGDINTKHILVKVSESATDEEKTEAENLAKEIISKLDEGKTFDEVKEEYADKITYEELGYKSYNASLESAYMEEMEKLSNNSYSKTPVKTSYGYHIVYRIDQKEKPSFDDVKEEMLDELGQQKSAADSDLYSKCLAKMRTDAGLTFEDTVLEKKYNVYVNN